MKNFKKPLSMSLFLFGLQASVASTSLNSFDRAAAVNSSEFSGRLGAWYNGLVDDVGEVPGNRFYGELDLRYTVDKLHLDKKSSSHFAAELKTRRNNEGQLMFSLKELAIGYAKPRSQFFLGRRNLGWSTVDREWGLGHTDNRVNFDFLEPGQEGLVGIFFNQSYRSGFRFGVFLTPLYVPELNPGQEIDADNGTVDCLNPWCNAPAETTEISGSEVRVFYNINVPEISDIVFQNAGGINLGHEFLLSESDKGNTILDISVYALRKPENSLTVSAEASFRNGPPQLAFVDITPQIFSQEIVGSDIKLNFKAFGVTLYGSAISVTPNGTPEGGQLFFEYTGVRQRKTREDYISAGVEYEGKNLYALAGFISRQSKFDRADDILVEFPRWSQAAHLIINKSFGSRFRLSLDYKFDMLTKDRLTLVRGNFDVTKNITAGVGLNIIGTDPNEESFWTNFENNDAAFGSLDYRF